MGSTLKLPISLWENHVKVRYILNIYYLEVHKTEALTSLQPNVQGGGKDGHLWRRPPILVKEGIPLLH